ncbi:TetR/AcrR family transcriptional regulator [Bdellovibrio sp.]|uniref:TetR/AcrR family transcriptional regulator n=1 Tax=Bdellovibrio sp. TaxID=28201 RepID=UPI0039E67FC9
MDTRTRALNLSRHYLQTLGFNGFSFQTIADALGIKKASLHYHFASKEDLGLALLEEYERSYKDWSEKVESLPAQKKLEQMLLIFYKMALDENKICPSGVLCSDFNTLPKNMKKQLLKFHEFQRAWLKDTLRQGVREKVFRKDLNIDATADLLLASVQGGLQMARLRGESETFKAFTKNLLKTL